MTAAAPSAERKLRVVPPPILRLVESPPVIEEYRDAALHFMLSREGYYANHSKDPGGETWRGVARKFWPRWVGWRIVDTEKARGGNWKARLKANVELEDLVRAFYIENFWLPNRCDKFDYVVALPLFDACVNSNALTFRKILQGILGVNRDGAIGPKTLARYRALDRSRGAYWIGSQVVDHRLQRYDRRLASGASPQVFALGWHRRIVHNTEEIAIASVKLAA